MARDPGSRWSPLPEAGAPDGLTKTQLIVHSTGTMASAAANFRYFSGANVVVESTFIIGPSSADPTLQIMDSTDRADANGSANNRAISIEVVGDGVGPYTQWQINELIRIGRWAASTHPIAKRVIPSEAASGFGWHVRFGAPGPWTSVRGKVCPGNARIDQLKRVVFPAIFATAPKPTVTTLPAPKPAPEEFDVTTTKQIAEIHQKVVGAVLPLTGRPGAQSDDMYGHVLSADAAARQALAEVAAVKKKLDELLALLKAQTPPAA